MSSSVIVVGIDGSAGSLGALHWALDEARLRSCAVEVVTVWPPRGGSLDIVEDEATELHRRASELQRHVLDSVLRDIDSPPAISCEVVRGEAIDVLVRASAHAELLVVGSHGVTGMLHAALGSVSEACARLAECPSVVVPAGSRPSGHQEVATVPGAGPSQQN